MIRVEFYPLPPPPFLPPSVIFAFHFFLDLYIYIYLYYFSPLFWSPFFLSRKKKKYLILHLSPLFLTTSTKNLGCFCCCCCYYCKCILMKSSWVPSHIYFILISTHYKTAYQFGQIYTIANEIPPFPCEGV